MPLIPLDQLHTHIGHDLGVSDWHLVDQARVDQFAEVTGDHQFIHVDPVKAAKTPFGGTIAHGFLSLSLIPALMEPLMVLPQNLKMAVNYGVDNVRFIQPVRTGERVRLHLTLLEAGEKNPGQWLLRTRATLQVEGRDKPALVAEPLVMCFI